MSISSTFKDVNNGLDKHSMFPVSMLLDVKKRDRIIQKLGLEETPTAKEIQAAVDFADCSIDDFYLTDSSIYPFAYYKDFVYIDLLSLETHLLDFMNINKSIKQADEMLREAIQDKDFSDLFIFIHKKISFDAYIKLYKQIPDEQKFKIFLDVYSHNEYGFGKISPDFLQDIAKCRNSEDITAMVRELDSLSVEGKLAIYRGEGTQSAPLSKAYSWSLNKSTAVQFAKRHEPHGKVYKAETTIDHVIAYLTGRGESEVLILPKDITSIVMLRDYDSDSESPYKIEDIFSDLDKNGFTKYLKPSLFNDPKSIHGVLHCKRVLFLSTILSHLLKLDKKDQIILYMASVYHDIGRTHDWEDEQHGYLGFIKADKLRLINLGGEEKLILKYIIDNHCINDKNAIQNVDGYLIEDRDRAIRLLKVFKDADGLDRVRLGDLDISYLRNREARRLKQVAEHSLAMLR